MVERGSTRKSSKEEVNNNKVGFSEPRHTAESESGEAKKKDYSELYVKLDTQEREKTR